MSINVIYENKDMVVCVKPQGVISECGNGSLPEMLTQALNCEIFPVHRLDRATGGIMVYAKNKKSAAALSSIIACGGMKKEYLAIVRGVPEAQADILTDFLYHDRIKNKSFVVKRGRNGVKTAVLNYKLLGSAEHNGQLLSLLQIRLQTGRTHQIRVQFSHRGLPLYGDGKYGGRAEREGLALWSFHLSLGEGKCYKSLPPDSFPWTLFEENLPR